MRPRRKLVSAVASAALVAGLLGPVSSAGAVTLVTGNNSPQGTNAVVVPSAATPGAINAFTQVITKGPGDISNLTFLP
jgi:hypothetical protein